MYARAQGLWGSPAPGSVDYDDVLMIDLGSIVPMVSGPKNPEEGVALGDAAGSFRAAFAAYRKGRAPTPASAASPLSPPVEDGSVVIAAITSCTNTSNPSVMVGAGLIAKRAVELGLTVPPHVKTSLAPGSKVVTAYLERAGLLPFLDRLGVRGRGVRMHHLHRQLRAAPAASEPTGPRPRPLRGGRPERQPELRGPGS